MARCDTERIVVSKNGRVVAKLPFDSPLTVREGDDSLRYGGEATMSLLDNMRLQQREYVSTAPPGPDPPVGDSYRFFRLTIIATAVPTQNFSGTRELEIRESVGGANALLGLTKVTTASDQASGGPALAFDGSYATGNGWTVGWVDGNPEWVQCELEVADAIIPVEYAIGGYPTATNTEPRSPGEFTLEGSNNGTDWTELDHQTGITWTGWDFTTPKVFTL